jgi:hypothetical protein
MQCYNVASRDWTGLEMSNDMMRGVRCVGWAPLGEIVAVGCEHGVCLWHLYPQNPWMSFFQHAGRSSCSNLQTRSLFPFSTILHARAKSHTQLHVSRTRARTQLVAHRTPLSNCIYIFAWRCSSDMGHHSTVVTCPEIIARGPFGSSVGANGVSPLCRFSRHSLCLGNFSMGLRAL